MLRVLTYHRISTPEERPDLDPRMISAAPEIFRSQMRHLSRYYRPVSLREILDSLDSGASLPRRSVLVTFDDAYRDFLLHAWPVLRDWSIPAVVFVSTAYPGDPRRAFWWDRLHRAVCRRRERRIELSIGSFQPEGPAQERSFLKQLGERIKSMPHSAAMDLVEEVCAACQAQSALYPQAVLNWDELRALASQGVAVGAHSRHHSRLDRLETEQARREIVGSQADLRREIGSVHPVFCYPGGGFNAGTVSVLREEGFRLAFTTRDGSNRLEARSGWPIHLNRCNITSRTTPGIFSIRLLPFFDRIDAWRHQRRAAS